MNQPSGEERRRHPRTDTEQRVQVVHRGKSIWGLMRNLSISGMLVEVERGPLPRRGQEVQVTFDAGEQEVATRAEIVRHQGRTAMGLRFLRLDADELAAIKTVTG